MKDYRGKTDEELLEQWYAENECEENPDADLWFEICKRAGKAKRFIELMQMEEIDEAMNLTDDAASFLYYRN